MSEMKRFLTYADLGLKPPRRRITEQPQEEAKGLRVRLRQHRNVLGPDDFAPRRGECEDGVDLGSLMMPGWAFPGKAVAPPREVPRGRIVGDDLTEAFMPTVGKADFREELHPRGEHGRWAPKGSTGRPSGGGGGETVQRIKLLRYHADNLVDSVERFLEEAQGRGDFSDIEISDLAGTVANVGGRLLREIKGIKGVRGIDEGRRSKAEEDLAGMEDVSLDLSPEELRSLTDRIADGAVALSEMYGSAKPGPG